MVAASGPGADTVKTEDRKASKHRDAEDRTSRLPKKVYEKELRSLQVELVKMEDWVARVGARVVVVFEGRDAAGKAARSNASRSS